MGIYLLVFLTSFLVVFICTPSLIRVTTQKNLMDDPGDLRKLHTKKIPTLGGVMIFGGTLFAYTLLLPFLNSIFNTTGTANDSISSSYLISSMLILFFIGIKDDIIGTSAIFKLLGHIAVAMILVMMGNVRITGFHGLFGITIIPYWASVFLSVFTYVVIVNAINFIDGVDGLAPGIGLICAASFGMWFALGNSPVNAALAFALSGSLFGFLIYNFSPAKIFMGDSGSLLVGLLLSVMGIKIIEFPPNMITHDMVTISRPLFVMSLLSYPLIDILRIVIYRSLKGVSPFEADRNHIHHYLLNLKLSQRKVSFSLYIFTMLITAITVYLKGTDPTLSFIIAAGIALIISQIPIIIQIILRKRKGGGIVKEMDRQQAI